MTENTTPTRVLIAGATRGIGRALAEQYLSRGAEVTGTCRGTPPDDRHRWLTLDVTDPAHMRQLARDLADQPLDLVICNAGIYLDKGDSLEDGYAAGLWADTFATNVTGVFLTVQALLPNLRMAPAGRLAIIGSQMGSSTKIGGSSFIYRASKAAVLNLGLNLAEALREDGIAVGVYHPGWVRTDMGGGTADIGTTEAASGLVECFDRLSPNHTGVFETWDGRTHPA